MNQNMRLPRIHALLLCQTVIVDRETGRHSVIGIYDQVKVEAFPTEQALTFYLCVEKGTGNPPIELEFVGPAGKRLFEATMTSNSWPESEIFESGLKAPPVIFARPGVYRLRASAEGELLAERGISFEANT